jgi:hypothetical protein
MAYKFLEVDRRKVCTEISARSQQRKSEGLTHERCQPKPPVEARRLEVKGLNGKTQT